MIGPDFAHSAAAQKNSRPVTFPSKQPSVLNLFFRPERRPEVFIEPQRRWRALNIFSQPSLFSFLTFCSVLGLSRRSCSILISSSPSLSLLWRGLGSNFSGTRHMEIPSSCCHCCALPTQTRTCFPLSWVTLWCLSFDSFISGYCVTTTGTFQSQTSAPPWLYAYFMTSLSLSAL